MRSNDLIFIITLNYNQNQYTLDCIQSILKSDYENFILFLIDNGSSQDNFEELKIKLPKDDRLILQRIDNNIGYVGGVNFGLKKGLEFNSSHFIIMNNDTIIDSKAISALYECCVRHDNKAIVAGKVYEYNDPNRIQTIGTFFKDKRYLTEISPGKGEIDNGEYEDELEMDLIDDILWIMPKTIIYNVGFYSSFFNFGSEQADFALSAVKKGYKLIFTPKSKIWHKGGASFHDKKEEPSKIFLFQASKGNVIYKYRNLDLKFFLISIIKSQLLILKTLFFKSNKYIPFYKILGLWSGIFFIVKNLNRIHE